MSFSELTDLTSAIYDAREQIRNEPYEPSVVSDVLFAFIMRTWDLPKRAEYALRMGLMGAYSAGEAYRAIRAQTRKARDEHGDV